MNDRYKQVADLLRTGASAPELEAEYEALEAERREALRKKPANAITSLWDLEVTRRCWVADARESER